MAWASWTSRLFLFASQRKFAKGAFNMTDQSAVQPSRFDYSGAMVRDNAHYAIIAISATGQVKTWNKGVLRIYGYAEDEIVGRHVSLLYTPDAEGQAALASVLQEASHRGGHECECRHVRQDGSTFQADVSITPMFDVEGRLDAYCQITREVLRRAHAQNALAESERNFRLLVQSVTDYAIYMLSPEGLVTSWNIGAARIKGYAAAEILGKHFSCFYTEEDIAVNTPWIALETAAREGRFEAEGWRVRRDGTRFWANVVIDAIRDEGGALIGFAKITRDITERRAATEALAQTRATLFQAQKMEAIGKLTGGVAHDFNNVLQILRGNLELLESRFIADSRAQYRLKNALDAVDKGAQLASQLLSFGRRQPLRPASADLGRLLQDMSGLLRGAIDETIAIETVVADGLWNALVDVYQLENVILNIALNARDAMPQGGKLTLEVSNVLLDDSTMDLEGGEYVLLAVSDTGVGMTSAVMEQAFEPFFTTKPEGMGTGLGLSTAYGFVKQSNGHIKIYSEIDHGTTIKIYLPRSQEAEAAPVLSSSDKIKIAGGNETILVVEDDPHVQATAVDILTQLGYRVLKADDADSALSILRSGINVQLLFTDVVMPGKLRSPELAKRAQQLIPDLKVLFTSGYTHNAIVHGGRLDPGIELLSKPYRREDLARKVRQMLGRNAGVSMPGDSHFAMAPTVRGLRILVVEDVGDLRAATCDLLTTSGHVSQGVMSAESALELLERERFDVVMVDVSLPGISGLELARIATERWPGLRIILATGLADQSVDRSGFVTLRKPYGASELQEVLQALQAMEAGPPE